MNIDVHCVSRSKLENPTVSHLSRGRGSSCWPARPPAGHSPPVSVCWPGCRVCPRPRSPASTPCSPRATTTANIFFVNTVNIFLRLLYREVLVHVALLPADVLPPLGAVPGRGRRGQRRGVPLAHELVLPVAGHRPPQPVTCTIIVVGKKRKIGINDIISSCKNMNISGCN